ncbi:PREDICTED: protein distal antenna [Vollenhovia emeryi]|uniref:protein distal antenna n=1 Tax=Vollenhovia emeryi TaxID=411798 RepID=UPI0005F49A0F|nr:PREDICTED: protein distal antenna [Vollenhovia emeryi]
MSKGTILDGNLDQSQEAAVDLSPEATGGATDRRDRRHARERITRPPSQLVSPFPTYNGVTIARYEPLNVSDPGPSTSQPSRQRIRNETRTAGKRPLRATTPQGKMDAITRVHAGESKAAVARDIGVPESTLRGWCKAEDKIRTQLNNVRTTGAYDQILTSSSDNSNNSPAESSARSTPTNHAVGPSICGAERMVDDFEPPLKQARLDTKNLTTFGCTVPMSNMTTSSQGSALNFEDPIYKPLLLGMMAHDPNSLHLFNTLVKASEHSMPFLSGFPMSENNKLLAEMIRLSSSNGMAPVTPKTKVSTTNDVPVNGRRKHNAMGRASVTEMAAKATTRRRNSQSPNTEKPFGNTFQQTNSRMSPLPSTSMNNGGVNANASAKSAKCGKNINDIVNLLAQQQTQQQARGAAPPVQEAAPPVQEAAPPVQEVAPPVQEGEILATNAVNNNNNINHANGYPPGINDMKEYCNKLIDWLERYGTAVCTFHQMDQLKSVLHNLMNWENVNARRNANGAS